MGDGFDHNKVIATQAKEALKPLGMKRRGRSRLWFADQGWWIRLVEFQASSWSRGSYLNVGGMWLWTPRARDSVAFDVFDRVEDAGYVEATDEVAFTQAAARIAEIAASRVTDLGGTISTPGDAADFISRAPSRLAVSHPDLNRGIAAGLSGDDQVARAELQAYTKRSAGWEPSDPDRAAIGELQEAVGTPAFASTVQEWITAQREALRLPT
jgi:hypothetical protein